MQLFIMALACAVIKHGIFVYAERVPRRISSVKSAPLARTPVCAGGTGPTSLAFGAPRAFLAQCTLMVCSHMGVCNVIEELHRRV